MSGAVVTCPVPANDLQFTGDQEADRRSAVRHAVDGFAEVVSPCGGFLLRGEISDLSVSGCFIKTRARMMVQRSAEVELRFTVRGQQFSVTARTASVRTGLGAGFEFLQVGPVLHKGLLDLIARLEIV